MEKLTDKEKLELLKIAMEMGADFKINFHNNQHLQASYDKLKPFTKLGSIKKDNHNGAIWVSIKNFDENIQITSFL